MVPDGGVSLIQGRSIRFHRESGRRHCQQNGAALSLADAYVRIRFAIFLARIFVSRPCTAWRAAPHSGLARKGAGFLHHRFRNIDL